MKVKNNTANLFDSLINEMEEYAINSLNSLSSERVSSFVPSTDELKGYYTQTLDEGKLPDKMTSDQEKIVKELKESALSGCKEKVKEDQGKINDALHDLEKNKDKDVYDKMISSLEEEDIETSTKKIREYYNKVRKLVKNTDDEAEKNFIIKASGAVMSQVRAIYSEIRKAILLAASIVYETIKAVWSKLKDTFDYIYKLISNVLTVIN